MVSIRYFSGVAPFSWLQSMPARSVTSTKRTCPSAPEKVLGKAKTAKQKRRQKELRFPEQLMLNRISLFKPKGKRIKVTWIGDS
jgi:hypothetical protein